MDRAGSRFARKVSHPLDALVAQADPFHLTLAGADLSDRGMAGELDGVSWELSWEPSLPAAEHVHPLLQRARIAKTVLVLPHPDLAVTGTVRFDGHDFHARRRARRAGAPVGLQARRALDLGARQRPARPRRRPAPGLLRRRRQRLRARASDASWARARRSSGASATWTSAPRARAGGAQRQQRSA
jgi:hypothetical protein